MEIRLDSFSKFFGQVKVIENLDLTVGDGEMIALLGPSGCGKTTTLYAICGLHRVSGGRIWFGDRDVTSLPPQEKNVGVVFQSFALYPHLTVYENIAFPLRIRKDSNSDIERVIKDITGTLHIEELLERRPAQLSGGQQQRVALARALVRRPDILLLDEPLANLDAGLRLEMRSEICRIQEESGCTSILVTHDQVEAMSMCNRIALMKEGVIQQIGTPDEMYHQPQNRFIASFIGNPPISFTDGTIEEGRFVSHGLKLNLPDSIKKAYVSAGQKVCVGVRPEYLQPGLSTPVEGEVTFIESQGREILYDLKLSDGQMLRSIQGSERICKLGDKVSWGIDMDAVLFFDEQGDRI
jgi:inositol-phosphate transport system ATP-binding protein